MEIYHRDNWIIIVHMATWKDLTKWNEENTIIDWNNYVGRIIKHVFPMLSRLRREGWRHRKHALDDPPYMTDPTNSCVLISPFGQIVP